MAKDGEARTHICLLGDSTLDNKWWVGRQPSVTEHLKRKAPEFNITNCAVDGALIRAVSNQLEKVPAQSTHLFVSVGGNDGLGILGDMEAGGLFNPCGWLRTIKGVETNLRPRYESMAAEVLLRSPPGTRVTLLTVYRPWFRHPFLFGRSVFLMRGEGRGARWVNKCATNLTNWWMPHLCNIGTWYLNRVIRRTAARHNLPVVDLFAIFDQAGDYANPIEPSAYGGDKTSDNILHVTARHDFTGPSVTYQRREYTAEVYEDVGATAGVSGPSGHCADKKDPKPTLNRTAENDRYRASGDT